MTKDIVFDFVCDTAVAVVAECGTNPEELKTEAIQILIQDKQKLIAIMFTIPIQDCMDTQKIFTRI